MQPLILPFHGKSPRIHDSAFIAPGAVIIGDVDIGPDASVWYGCILRADCHRIVVGARSNVQDGTVIHVDAPDTGGTACFIGEDVLIGHKCMLHGCTIEDQGFVGMSATVLDGATVSRQAFLAAGAFLGGGKTVPTGELWAGLPARKVRELKPGEDRAALMGAAFYVKEAEAHKEALVSYGQSFPQV